VELFEIGHRIIGAPIKNSVFAGCISKWHCGGINSESLSTMPPIMPQKWGDVAGPKQMIMEVKLAITLNFSDTLKVKLAGGLGLEPRLAESESAVLPLDDPPGASGKGVHAKIAVRPSQAARPLAEALKPVFFV
jgi:hypothetical protein